MKKIILPFIAFTGFLIYNWEYSLILAGVSYAAIGMVFLCYTESRMKTFKIEVLQLDEFNNFLSSHKSRLSKICDFITTQNLKPAHDRYYYRLVAPEGTEIQYDVDQGELKVIPCESHEVPGILMEKRILDDLKLYFEALVAQSGLQSGSLIAALNASRGKTDMYYAFYYVHQTFGFLSLAGGLYGLNSLSMPGIFLISIGIFYLMVLFINI